MLLADRQHHSARAHMGGHDQFSAREYGDFVIECLGRRIAIEHDLKRRAHQFSKLVGVVSPIGTAADFAGVDVVEGDRGCHGLLQKLVCDTQGISNNLEHVNP